MEKGKIKFVIGMCVVIVLLLGAYLFYLELDKNSTSSDSSNTKVVGN